MGAPTLDTALVHEAYLKLAKTRAFRFRSRGHFFATISKAMRHALVNYAEGRRATKRGGGAVKVTLNEQPSTPADTCAELVSVDKALADLEELNPRQARVVECLFFAGLGVAETAEALDTSPATVKRDWSTARSWLYAVLHNAREGRWLTAGSRSIPATADRHEFASRRQALSPSVLIVQVNDKSHDDEVPTSGRNHRMPSMNVRGLDDATTEVPSEAVETLGASLRGDLIAAESPGYDEIRTIWNGMIDRRPALIARCHGAADVMQAVRFASEHRILTSVRGAGHNIAGNSIADDTLMIDLAPMSFVRVDAANRTAIVGPGTTLGDVDRKTQAFGLAVPTGINSTTGSPASPSRSYLSSHL